MQVQNIAKMGEESEEGRQLSILVKNPLLFDHIVHRVISFVDVEFLPSCRQVNRQWEKFALSKLLQNIHKIPVVIRGSKKRRIRTASIGQDDTSSEHDSKMAQYLAHSSKNAKKPRLRFSNFKLKNIPLSNPLLPKFFSTNAAGITDLRLKINFFRTGTLLNCLSSLENLKTLTLDVSSWCKSSGSFHTPSKKFNLKRLCLNYKGFDREVYNDLRCLLRACGGSLEELSLGKRTSWRHLQKYFLHAVRLRYIANALVEISVERMDSMDLEYLIGLDNLKFKAFKCQSLILWDGDNIFSGFLEKYKSTMESVEVGKVKTRRQWDVEKTAGYEITFPDVMPKLKVLQMGLPSPSPHGVLQTRRIDFKVNFPAQLPSLEKLILYDGSIEDFQGEDSEEWEYLSRLLEDSDPHPKLMELCLPFASSKLRKSAGYVFPEIRFLKMECGLDGSAHEIWKMWPKLKSLDLTLYGDQEEGMENRVEDFITGTKNEGISKDIESNLPSITNFKDLKQLKLRMIGDCGGSLTDFSVSQGFCKLPRLEFLLLSHHNISEEGTMELLKYHSLLKKVDCPVHPEVFKIQREYLPNDFIPSGFSTGNFGQQCDCSFLDLSDRLAVLLWQF